MQPIYLQSEKLYQLVGKPHPCRVSELYLSISIGLYINWCMHQQLYVNGLQRTGLKLKSGVSQQAGSRITQTIAVFQRQQSERCTVNGPKHLVKVWLCCGSVGENGK